MIKPNQVPTSRQALSTTNLNEYISQSLRETLTLMKRFEETGMDVVMKDDYLALYDIYQRLYEQKQNLPPWPASQPVT